MSKLPAILALFICCWLISGNKLLVNGEPHEVTPGSYAEIRRQWNSGDEIELTLPMEPQLVEAHPLVEETRNQIAVKRGPLVYCLESI